MINSFFELKDYIKHDYYRIYKTTSKLSVFKSLFFGESFKYVFWLRVCAYLNGKNKILYFISKIILRHYKYKFTICIPDKTTIGKGFYIGHFGSVFVSPKAVIGENCNISQGVTVGQVSRGVNKGAPSIGNNVYIGPGAKVFGGVSVGDNVAIGANAVVTKDIPSDCSVGGVPAKIISRKGSFNYINNTLSSEQ